MSRPTKTICCLSWDNTLQNKPYRDMGRKSKQVSLTPEECQQHIGAIRYYEIF